jgi:2-(1,2-epoxy-1,2-dihydrophenyl)acetyl-CoA isomerase
MALSYEQVVDRARADERSLVSVQRDGARAVVTLDDPERFNPLSAELTVQLYESLADLARDPELRTIVLTGRDPAFSAGGDLRLIQASTSGCSTSLRGGASGSSGCRVT